MVDAVRMTADEVHRVIDALADPSCLRWLEGGWGVRALVGRQTSRHRDLDLAFDESHEDSAFEVLAILSCELETDWRPVRFELAAPPSRYVDMRPVVLNEDGNGVQAGPNGTTFDYPAAPVTTEDRHRASNELHLRDLQLRFHSGYDPGEIDKADLGHSITLPLASARLTPSSGAWAPGGRRARRPVSRRARPASILRISTTP